MVADSADVSVIDLSLPDDELLATLIPAACHGFFRIKNHGIPQSVIDNAFGSSVDFLHKPHDFKLKSGFDPDYFLGWSYNNNHLELPEGEPLVREQLEITLGSAFDRFWPDIPHFKDNTEALAYSANKVTRRLARLFAIGAGLEEDFFEKHMRDVQESSYYTYNKYPAITPEDKIPEETLRILPHTDPHSCLTLLFHRTCDKGLQVAPGCDMDLGAPANVTGWTALDPVPGQIICQLGDIMQYWSDGLYKSTFHRVRMPYPDEFQGERLSIAFFQSVPRHTTIQGPKGKYPPASPHKTLYKAAQIMIENHTKPYAEQGLMPSNFNPIAIEAN